MKKAFLNLYSPTEAPEPAIAGYYPVAGDNNRQGVSAQSLPYRS